MNTSCILFIFCLQIFLIQIVFCQYPGNYGSAATVSGFASGTTSSYGPDSYGGIGEGTVAVTGELPVIGSTAVIAQVPILGEVSYGGALPAAGSIIFSGNCLCTCGGIPIVI